MRKTFGARRMTKPEGMLRAVHFPTLCLTDVRTGDGRILEEAGGGVRDLSLTIWGQFIEQPGHDGAVPTGALDEVTFEEDGNVSGWGWFLDDENGRTAVRYLETGAMRGNSVNLADISASLEWDEAADEALIRFSQWNIAGTCQVGRPAFKEAYAELDEEIVASWYSNETPLVADLPFTINIEVAHEEVTASGAPRPDWDMFHFPESPTPQPHFVGEPDENGFIPVFGHLGLWNSCHDGIEGTCTMIPRPVDNYAGFNSAGVLTNKGRVNTGPLFLRNGHPKAGELNRKSVDEAYGGTENAWADVRITAGVLGPWYSGYVRPGTPEESVVVARASKVSGHWKGGALKAVVSVNVPGYEVASVESFNLDSSGIVDELVASFPACFTEQTETVNESVEEGADETAVDSDVEFTQVDLDLAMAIQDMETD
jgi:hypothetical protein